ncbi:lactate/malate family dehydrogenase [Holospora curviuscula]|nr:hypothetical protein [Holospora curviuscula]
MILQHIPQVHIGLYDVNEDLVQGKVWDLEEASIIGGYEGHLEVLSSLRAFEEYDVLVITAGRSRTPGMNRNDLLQENAKILKSISRQIQEFRGVAVVVTNPVDLMARFFSDLHPLPSSRVLGMAGILDESRMAARIKAFTGMKGESLRPCVVGPHSDRMIPLEYVRVGPGALADIISLSVEQKVSIVQNTRYGGVRIVEKLKSGSAFYGPAAGCFRMIQNILEIREDVLTCSVQMGEESPIQDITPKIFFGWPVLLGKQGIKKRVMPCMSAQETSLLRNTLLELQIEYKSFFESLECEKDS